MKKIEAIVRPLKLEELKAALHKSNINGLTISQVIGCGNQRGWTEYYRSNEVLINVLPKVQITIVTSDDRVDEIVKVITSVARTGEVGDGKIFISNIEDVIRIRTGENGDKGL